MSAIFPTAIAVTLDLLQAINNTKVTLNVDAGIGDTTLTVDDASPLPTSGYLTFDDNESNPETVKYTGKSGNNLTGVTRGADSTAAGTHTTGAHIEQRWNAAYHNTLVTELIAVEQNISDRFGLDTGTHVAKFVDGTVSLPSLTFASDTNTGIYRIGADDVAIATGGVKALEVNATQQVVIPKTSSQMILGTTNTVTISATAPSVSRTLTIPDPGTNASFVMTEGTQTINAINTYTVAIAISPTTNQLVLGATRTVTITAPTPAVSSRTWTIPDITGNGTFAALEGTQTFSGSKTFSAALTVTGGIVGVATNSDATAGNVGEATRSFAAVVNPTSNTWTNITSVSLTAGDYDVSAVVTFDVVSGTSPTHTQAQMAISKNSGGTTTDHVYADNTSYVAGSPTSTTDTMGSIPCFRVSIASTTTYFIKGLWQYAAGSGNVQIVGRISARRVR